MHEPDTNQRVVVTTQERAHPAIAKLARACIALARHMADSPVPQASHATPTLAPDQQPGQEVSHD